MKNTCEKCDKKTKKLYKRRREWGIHKLYSNYAFPNSRKRGKGEDS